MFCPSVAGYGERDRLHRRNCVKAAALLFPIQEIRVRGSQRCTSAIDCASQPNNTIWIMNRQRTDEYRIHHTENCRIQANAQYQGRQHKNRHPRPLKHKTQAETYVLNQRVQKVWNLKAPVVALLLKASRERVHRGMLQMHFIQFLSLLKHKIATKIESHRETMSLRVKFALVCETSSSWLKCRNLR